MELAPQWASNALARVPVPVPPFAQFPAVPVLEPAIPPIGVVPATPVAPAVPVIPLAPPAPGVVNCPAAMQLLGARNELSSEQAYRAVAMTAIPTQMLCP